MTRTDPSSSALGPAGEGRALDVLSFGEALVDFFPLTPGVPLESCAQFQRHLGGAPANVAVGLARLGLRVGLMTRVGPDAFGRFVRAQLEREGVDVSEVGAHPTAKTGITFVAVGPRGERSFLFFRHPSADQLITPEEVRPAAIARAHVLHLGSSTLAREPARSATLKAIEEARRAGCVLSTDPNWRPHLWDDPTAAAPLLRGLLGQCQLVKISDDELLPLVGTSDPEAGAQAVRELGPEVVVVTLGERGCYFAAPAGQGQVPAPRGEVVDTTGAGDAFMAGLLSVVAPAVRAGRRPGGLDLEELRLACTEGNRLGASVVAQLGATSGLPERVGAPLPEPRSSGRP